MQTKPSVKPANILNAHTHPHTHSHTRTHTHTQSHTHTPACDNDGLLSIPGRVISHDFGVGGDVLGRELRELVGLRVHPAQRLHVLARGRQRMLH